MKTFLIKYFGPNYRARLTGVGTLVSGGLTFLAALPYQIEDVGMLVPPAWKGWIVKIGLISTGILKFWNVLVTKASNVSGNAATEVTVATKKGEEVTIVQPVVESPKVTSVIEPTPPKP